MSAVAEPPAPAAPEDEIPEGWRRDRQNRLFAPARGRSGNVFRRENETVAEAQARDERDRGKDRRPKPKPAPAKGPAEPRSNRVTTQQIEAALRMLLASPSFIASLAGDEFLEQHFEQAAPALARALANLAEKKPALHAKLATLCEGGGVFGDLGVLLPLGMALAAYLLPVILHLADRAGIRVFPQSMYTTFGMEREEPAEGHASGLIVVQEVGDADVSPGA